MMKAGQENPEKVEEKILNTPEEKKESVDDAKSEKKKTEKLKDGKSKSESKAANLREGEQVELPKYGVNDLKAAIIFLAGRNLSGSDMEDFKNLFPRLFN